MERRHGRGSEEEEGGREVSDPAWHFSEKDSQATCIRASGKLSKMQIAGPHPRSAHENSMMVDRNNPWYFLQAPWLRPEACIPRPSF